MNDFQNIHQTMNENFKTGLRQWQDVMQAWNGFAIEAGQTGIDTLFALREQTTGLWTEANRRAQDLATREHKLVIETAISRSWSFSMSDMLRSKSRKNRSKRVSSLVAAVKSLATGGSLTPLTVMKTVAVAVPPRPSLMA